MKRFLFLIAIVIVAISCNKNKRELQNSLLKVFNKSRLESAEYCVILPRVGCSGCINNATNFVVNNLDNMPNSLVLLTGVEDNKILRIQLGEEFLKKENVVIDKENEFKKPSVASLYPRIVYLKEGQVIEVSSFDLTLAQGLVYE